MSEYAVITENDESPWEDVTGALYHFPNTYKEILTPGCKVIYYKGKLRDKQYAASRLSEEPHYFGYAVIGESVTDPNSRKGDLFCEILNYHEFTKPVYSKVASEYLEPIPESRKLNYWRFGVREINKDTYEKILSLSEAKTARKKKVRLPRLSSEFESTRKEGEKRQRYTTYYERNPMTRIRAIEIHGLTCKVCSFNFSDRYGKLGDGFIHVHHLKPVSELDEAVVINPSKDLIVLCANCHAIVHRDKEHTLTLEELKCILS